MKLRHGLLWILPGMLFCNEYSLSLGRLGSVRYLHEDGRLLHVDRISPEGEILYTHSYRYNEQGKILSENLIGDNDFKGLREE